MMKINSEELFVLYMGTSLLSKLIQNLFDPDSCCFKYDDSENLPAVEYIALLSLQTLRRIFTSVVML